MQKVYLLLRQNQQSGPHNLSQLLQFDLSPYDLVWIEGQSAGWYYPQEIEELRPHLPFLQNATPLAQTFAPQAPAVEREPTTKKVFVSLPGIGSQATAPQPAAYEPLVARERVFEKPSTLQTAVAEFTTGAGTAVHETKTTGERRKTRPTASAKKTALALCLLGGAALAAWWLSSPAEQRLLPANNDAAITLLPQENTVTAETETATVPATNPQKKNNLPERKQTAGRKTTLQTRATVASQGETKQPVIVPAEKEQAPPEEVNVVAEEKTETAKAEPPKEKKRLRDRVAELFGKKPVDKQEEAKPAEDGDGRRQSTRREAGSSLVQLVTVRFDVPNDWMLGIKGAKATLTNRSGETLAKAAVQVVYYNDEGDVVDKRTVNFSNVRSKQTQTVSIPDHQTATRLEYNVISAAGISEPMAKQ